MADRRARRAALLRPARFDDLGLRRARADRLLPVLVGAMAFLAALACSAVVAAATLARHWQEGAAASLTVQVPRPGEPARAADGGTRRDAVLAIVRGTPGIAAARALSDSELSDLLRPWLGSSSETMSLPLPAVVAVHLNGGGPDLDALGARLDAAAPGTLVERHDLWVRRLAMLARSLQACAGMALLVVAAVAALVVAVATRAGLAARREAIEIVHGLGATDNYIAARFARRATLLAAAGAAVGAAAALPVLLGLADLAAPFAKSQASGAGGGAAYADAWSWLTALPLALWLVLPALPVTAAAIGWWAAQATVRRWLRRLP